MKHRPKLEAGEEYCVDPIQKLHKMKNYISRYSLRGDIKIDYQFTLDDKCYLRAMMPNAIILANIVDDHLMQISHVIRVRMAYLLALSNKLL